VTIGNLDRCLVLRSNSVRAIEPFLSLCRYARLLTPKLQQTDANPNLLSRTRRIGTEQSGVASMSAATPATAQSVVSKGGSVMDNRKIQRAWEKFIEDGTASNAVRGLLPLRGSVLRGTRSQLSEARHHSGPKRKCFIVDESGLAVALQRLVERSRVAGWLRCNFRSDNISENSLPPRAQRELLRIAQEAIHNRRPPRQSDDHLSGSSLRSQPIWSCRSEITVTVFLPLSC